MKIKISKSALNKEISHIAWKTLGTATRGEIAKEYARIVMNSSTYPKKLKVYLLGALSHLGWSLTTLAKEGYGCNTARGGKWPDRAGKLNAKNKATLWVYHTKKIVKVS
jgi:hypothetical protein